MLGIRTHADVSSCSAECQLDSKPTDHQRYGSHSQWRACVARRSYAAAEILCLWLKLVPGRTAADITIDRMTNDSLACARKPRRPPVPRHALAIGALVIWPANILVEDQFGRCFKLKPRLERLHTLAPHWPCSRWEASSSLALLEAYRPSTCFR